MTNRYVESPGRRYVLTLGAFSLGAVFTGFLEEIGKQAFGYVFLRGLSTGVVDKPLKVSWGEVLFGDNPSLTAIMPPGTNKHLLAQGVFTPSRYVKKAFEVATATHKSILGVKKDEAVNYDNKWLNADQSYNLLVLGGPVATDLTKLICGYHDFPAGDEAGKLVPIIDQRCILPYYFYVGDKNGYGYWNGEKRLNRRWLENGTEKKLPLYGIIEGATGTPIPPPIIGDRVAGDMLMITRVPNPANEKGSILIIGGLHGYSLEHFFTRLEHNMSLFSEVLNPEGHEFFQAMIPYSIQTDHTVSPIWNGSGDWRPRIKKIDPVTFLSNFRERTDA